MTRIVNLVREAVTFVLGVILIADAAFGHGVLRLDRVLELVVGLLLIGVIPVERVLDRFVAKAASA